LYRSGLARRSPLPEIEAVKNRRSFRAIAAAALAIALATTVQADSSWQTDYKKAQEEAKSSNKLLLVDFTGSDWCGYCIKLDRDILSKSEFKDYANKNLVLMEVDFPRTKAQSDAVKRQNQELAQQYQVQGFPTLVVLNGDGRKVWEYEGYFPDGPQAFIAALEKLRKG
jgi:thioredoxin-related protein